MISFEDFTMQEGTPIYRQLLHYIKRGVCAGSISDGDELPSRRVLSALLGVNPNTVQKAYRMLEEEGLIISHSGAKSFMQLNEEMVVRLRAEMLESEIGSLVSALKQTGISRQQALEMFDEMWGREEAN